MEPNHYTINDSNSRMFNFETVFAAVKFTALFQFNRQKKKRKKIRWPNLQQIALKGHMSWHQDKHKHNQSLRRQRS